MFTSIHINFGSFFRNWTWQMTSLNLSFFCIVLFIIDIPKNSYRGFCDDGSPSSLFCLLQFKGKKGASSNGVASKQKGELKSQSKKNGISGTNGTASLKRNNSSKWWDYRGIKVAYLSAVVHRVFWVFWLIGKHTKHYPNLHNALQEYLSQQ